MEITNQEKKTLKEKAKKGDKGKIEGTKAVIKTPKNEQE